MTLLTGDYGQTLPVTLLSRPDDELSTYLKSSILWLNIKILNLSKNMRVQSQGDRFGEIILKQFIDIGNDKIPRDDLADCITFPVSILNQKPSISSQFIESKTELIQKVFPNVAPNYRD